MTQCETSINRCEINRWHILAGNKGRIVPHLGFSQTHKIGNIGIIANFVVKYMQFPSLLATHDVLNEILSCNSITFQGCRFHWSNSLLMTQLKHKVGNIGILVLWRVCEKPNCLTRSEEPGTSMTNQKFKFLCYCH